MVTGDVVIMQNPECLHIGNIIQTTVENIKENRYLIFGCYSINADETDKISSLEYNDNFINGVVEVITPMNHRKALNGINSAWFQHSKWRPELLHFCAAMTKKNLDELGGFDERFAYGVAKDDREFIIRIMRKRMNIIQIDNPFVLHQQHVVTNRGDAKLVNNNRLLFNQIQGENKIKANE